MPKPNPWNQDNRAAQAAAIAKKAAAKAASERGSWWADPGITREEFQRRLTQRHAEILNSASNATRSINRAI
jgi:hypothetical protein